ncbi:MAG: DUF5106 domain-containing protein [Cytophagales bacterium]|nr:DUF5106 domain-containing protein [Cytophagales bacterium]
MRVIAGVFLFLLSFQLSAQQAGYDIRMSVKGIEDKELMLGVHYGGKQYLLDTAQVVGQAAHFTSADDTLKNGIYFIYSPDFYVEFVVHDEPVKFAFETQKEDPVKHLKVHGSTENQVFANYQRFIQAQTAARKALSEGAKDADEAAKKKLDEQIEKLSKAVREHQDSITRNYSNTMLAKVIRLGRPVIIPESITDQLEKYKYAQKHFFDDIDLNDQALIRTPLFESKVDDYLEKYTIRMPDSVMLSIDRLVALTDKNNENQRHILVTLLNKYANTKYMGMEQVFVDMAEKYFLSGKASWMTEKTLADIRKNVNSLRPNLIGQPAPQIHLVDTTLTEPIFMEYITDPDYLVLYFYDPDCGFCKKETPALLKDYDGIRDLNAEVLGITTITDVKRWKSYVKEMDMRWINGADPYGRSPFREMYYIKSTPMIYILDRNREIIARRIGAGKVKEFIKFHQKQKKEENRQ